MNTVLRVGLIAFLAFFHGGVAFSEVARVRSGDHPTFSRLVIELTEAADWSLGRSEDGYVLDVGRDDIEFDLSQVYRLISRDRIADIRRNADTGHLEISVECDCHAVAQSHRESWIIVDVLNGSPPPDSPFEKPLSQSAGVEPPEPEASQTLPQISSDRTSRPVFLRPPQRVQEEPSVALPDFAEWETDWNERLLPVPDAEDPDDAESSSRIAEQEALLLEELARAASQGLLEADLSILDRARDAAPPPEPVEITTPEPASAPPPALEDHIRLQAETSIDRDAGVLRPTQSVSPEGRSCLPDEFFAFSDWGPAEDLSAGLTGRRNDLVGEFDRPDPEAVLGLARYYLYLGFGAEAKATVRAFDPNLPEAEIVVLLAGILDGDAADLPGSLAGQTGCEGRVALWSVLAQGGPQSDQQTNVSAILSNFSGLPLHLRRHVGPMLTRQFLDAGDIETATLIRNAISRAPGDHGANFELANAELALAEGDQSALETLETLVDRDGDVATQAYTTFLEAELDAGRLPRNGAETAAALAFEIAGSETGENLSALAIRAMLAAGEFDAARREILRDEDTLENAANLWPLFLGAVTDGATDAQFLQQVFAVRDVVLLASVTPDVATSLSRRMTGLGFPEEALRYLPNDVSGEPARLARADALLAAGAPAEAFGELAGLEGPIAERLRARALLALGDGRGSSERFAAAGDLAQAERAAWLSGEWDLLTNSTNPDLASFAAQQAARLKSEADQAFQSDIQDPNLSTSDQPAGRAARARQSLEAVQSAKERLDALLSNAELFAQDPS